jgi:hypothetical protein
MLAVWDIKMKHNQDIHSESDSADFYGDQKDILIE